ncbi:MAG: hypothetical protein A2315_13215 [Ignavibacteria bacterium RIFOXYB2_FULL_35_12]|nr:MAG: hypothetical protein A2058_05845 [Ignavibacteria bacterium GWA2_36_19]OGU55580.1 MAG: hypothetical protein A2006_06110 [Ignavibacteria bacterium GWC2_35_8]OGU61859.1 MAG: hypothetical protein A2X60_07755 [Ignavibacteria bacterium GWF2_35_20]OGU88229.1 MAG: hypothetical protein A3K31_09865 [Ignavibacteria bacterium RIFOXYA12_FULL_35_25]OGU91283.1 MAG: hypothetical protein A2492_03865 [Ignavibacteria bacterium RIFOXYC12_FULL_35_11]OGU93225.1 MAG: hypothetical protein A2347_08380 [Ignavib
MKTIILLLLFLFFISSTAAQIVYEPLYKTVYPFMERLSHRGIIELNDLIKPLSKKYIADKLLEAKSKVEMLTDLEKEELEFFEKDYFLEIEGFAEKNIDKKYLSYFEGDEAERFRFFSYSDKTFKLNANPILGFKLKYPEKERILHTWMGISTYGYLLNNIGISLHFQTNNEKGNKLDIKKEFTPETGIIPEVSDYGRDISYTEVTSSISADWGWGNVVIAKDYIEYGYAKFGNLVLSNKAPSFPYIRIDLKPVDWFKFTYFHAWLSSTVIDSAKLIEYKRDIFRDKYMAWQSLTVTPLKGLDISIGESVVYSDKIEFLYLMPVMVYYLADEYISNRENKPGDANQQIFLSISSKDHLINTHFYGTLFIDELTIGGLNASLAINPTYGGATTRRQRTQLGFTLGLSVTDIPIDNLTLNGEYTKLYPFVYGHHDPAQTYRNSDYLMGHWMGHNSDLIYLDLNYRFLRGLEANLWGAYIRQGSQSYSRQYTQPEPDFLFGLRNNYNYFGLDLKYELIHELSFETSFKLTNISNEQKDGLFMNEQIREYSFLIHYGL